VAKSRAPHTVKRYDTELAGLKAQVLGMGGLVEGAISNAMRALVTHDTALARQTIDHDLAINAVEVECDDLISRIIALRQPAAGDMRFILAAVKAVTDLERMGDLAAGICEGVVFLDERPLHPSPNLAGMGRIVESQVERALKAFSDGDIDLAMAVIENDHTIDTLYQGMYREVLTYMLENPQYLSGYIILSNVAKNLERIGDHATNICEMVIYMIRGHNIRHVDHDAAAALLKRNAADPVEGD
jgi:phosphate transport system protein